jgi:hypothetical protein
VIDIRSRWERARHSFSAVSTHRPRIERPDRSVIVVGAIRDDRRVLGRVARRMSIKADTRSPRFASIGQGSLYERYDAGSFRRTRCRPARHVFLPVTAAGM